MNKPHQDEEISTEARLDAIEMLLQQLVIVLEAESDFTVVAFDNWMHLVRDRMLTHRVATPVQLQALARLQEQVVS